MPTAEERTIESEKTQRRQKAKGKKDALFWLSVCFIFLGVFCETVVCSDPLPLYGDVRQNLGVTAWHARGWRGQGLKVAVLDTGFHGYKAHLGAALPSNVQVLSFRFDGDLEAKHSQHGILCAEVIHTLAPEAEILLANWEPECPEQFLAAARWARQQGARILSCSIIMPSWSDSDGHGRVHEELTSLLAPPHPSPFREDAGVDGDALFFASAGNTAQRHWNGPFEDGGDGFHVWRDSAGVSRRENIVRPWGSERVSVELCCPSTSAYEVVVSDAALQTVVARAKSIDGGKGAASAVAAFMPSPGHNYHVKVSRPNGAKTTETAKAPFHLFVLGGSLRHATSPGSIPFPGDGGEVIAVGAADAFGRRLAYSSCGQKGSTIKPDLVATVPFPSRWRSSPFAGTSAAAPQASALAAIVWSRHQKWNASQIRKILQNAARPCSECSHSWETGYGLLRLLPPD